MYIKRYQIRANDIPFPHAIPNTKEFLINGIYKFHNDSEESIRRYYRIQDEAFVYFMNMALKNNNLVVKFIDAFPDENNQIFPSQSTRTVLACEK